MRAVINVEGALALLMLLCSIGRFAAKRTGLSYDENSQRREWLLLLLVIPAALFWTLSIPLVSDDFVSISAALRFTPAKIAGLFTIPESNHFFRPLGYISFAFDALWAGRSPALWHLAALLIHFANCILLYFVARQTGLTRFAAAAALVIFGIHGSRPEAVTWIAGRFDLLATLFVLATLALFMRGRYLVALATAGLALISKESAYVLPVLLLLITDRPQWRRVAPFAALTSAVFLYRWHVVSGIGGYQTAANTAEILDFSLLRTANALLLRLWATLFFPINWSEGSQWWLWIALVLGVAGYAVITLRGGQRRALAFLLFTFVAAIPVQHLLLIGVDLEKSRILYLPSVGFALFLAAALETLREPKWRVSAAFAVIAFQAACLEHNLIVWSGVAQVARTACDSVAASLADNSRTVTVLDLPSVLHGVYFLHDQGMPYCLELGHGIEARRVRDDNADLILRWDPRTEKIVP